MAQEQSGSIRVIQERGPELTEPLVQAMNPYVRSFEWEPQESDLWIESRLMWKWNGNEDPTFLAFLWELQMISRISVNCEYDTSCRSHYDLDSPFMHIDIIDEWVLEDIATTIPPHHIIYLYFSPPRRNIPEDIDHRSPTYLGD
ncbi:hypothetical protein O6H91_Y582900 [Diphasiastrum complanatum]|nr:hypothetical protein O6H91_Y582900 [Diphasiastrum complanatum]